MKVFIKVEKLTIRKDRKFKLSYYRGIVVPEHLLRAI